MTTAIPAIADAQAPVPCDPDALVAAITAANATPAPDTLRLAPGCTYSLSTPDNDQNGLPIVTSPINIIGNNATIARAALASNFRIFEINPPGDLRLDNLTVRNGHAESGGGIWLNGGGRLALNRTTVTENVAEVDGGGIAAPSEAGGTVTINNSTLTGNTALLAGGGMVSLGDVTIINSNITGNTATDPFSSGGGIASFGGNLRLSNSSVRTNTAGAGGGIFAAFVPTTITNTIVSDNIAVLSGFAAGAGIFFAETTLNVTSSQIRNNHAIGEGSQAGGLANFGTGAVTLRSSTVTGNTSMAAPGGIWNDTSGTVQLIATAVFSNIPTNCTGSPGPVPGCVG